MIIKNMDEKNAVIETLETLAKQVDSSKKKLIEDELRTFHAGIKGEKESAYQIDFYFGASKNWVVIHDLRLEVGGRVAQIDHLLINRMLECYVLESKHFSSGLKITEDGEFLRWNQYKKTYEGMASPLEQNQRHIVVLKEVEKYLRMPTRLGLHLQFSYHPYILVSPTARVDRPKNRDTSHVIKADMLHSAIMKDKDSTFLNVTKVVSSETIAELARQLVNYHTPITINYRLKFGITEQQPASVSSVSKDEKKSDAPVTSEKQSIQEQASFICRHCNSPSLAVQYGRYGYYFKCSDCDQNTPIKISCGQVGHKERIRKDGVNFYRECDECRTSKIFFTNAA